MFILKRSTKMLSLFFLVLFVSSTGLLFASAANGGSVTYSGYVYNLSSNPISGATVRLTINDDLVPVYRQTTSSATGYYSVTTPYDYATPPVDIALSASKSGYLFGSYGATVNDGSYTHNFYLELDVPPVPEVGWVSPASGATITFPPTDNDFSFTYSADNIDYTRLYIGPAGTSPTIQFGSDWTNEGLSISKTVDIDTHMGDFHGMVRADLRGYVSSSVVVASTRTFNFSKQIAIESELLEEKTVDLGSRLLQIIYDPPGDQSYSSYTTETKVVMINSLSADIGGGFEIQLGETAFGFGVSSKLAVDFTLGGELGWGTSVTDIEQLTSSSNSAERDLVGPGYGDLYYGEIMAFLFTITGTKITYSDLTVAYTDPVLTFGFDYSECALLSRENAPESWKEMNPNINTALQADPSIVEWTEFNSELEGGGFSREVVHETTDTNSWGWSFQFSVEASTKAAFGLSHLEYNGHFSTKYEYDETTTTAIKTLFHIEDDDSADFLHYDVGIDKRFGTPIFRNYYHPLNPLVRSETSSPWEYNTLDIISPVTTYPTITYNTDGDAYSPSEADTPLVELTITDEAEIDYAYLTYSHDNGSHWNVVVMSERLNDPDSWYANLPEHEHETEVLWYIFTADANGNTKMVLDVNSNYFSYTVVNRPCSVTLISPNGGSVYDETILVEWSGTDLDGDSLTYSIGYRIGGGSWTLIALGLTNTSYLWDISGIADSGSVSVKVQADDGYGFSSEDESDFVFGIDNEDTPEATILTPLTSFGYQGIVTITWSANDPDEYITGYVLYYSEASGTPSWILLESGLAEDATSYEWNTSAIVYSANVRLKLTVQNSLAETVETTTGIFTLDNRPSLEMNLINPNGGEIFTTSCLITWNLDYTNPLILYQIQLEYSYNSSSWVVITSGITGTSYNWNTTGLQVGTNYRLKITLTATYLGYALDPIVDISENTFMILDSTTIPTDLNSVPLIVTVIALVTLILPVLKLKKRNQKKFIH